MFQPRLNLSIEALADVCKPLQLVEAVQEVPEIPHESGLVHVGKLVCMLPDDGVLLLLQRGVADALGVPSYKQIRECHALFSLIFLLH